MKIDKSKIGQVLIWIGVSTWIPYFYLLIIGKALPLYVFLPIHLAFVLSGVRLRKSSENEETDQQPKKSRQVSQVLLYIGMAAWLPYFYVHYYYQLDVGHTPFLILHLVGMLGGGFFRFF
jgi:hypothetical protein